MLPIPTILGFAGLEILVPERGTFFPGNTTRVLLNYKLWLLCVQAAAGKKRSLRLGRSI